MKCPRLFLRLGSFSIGWSVDDLLGNRFPSHPETELIARLIRRAYPPSVFGVSGIFYWEDGRIAQSALLLASIIIRHLNDGRVFPDWAADAHAAGWRPPKDWLPPKGDPR